MSDGKTIKVRRLDDGTFVQELDDGTFPRLESKTDWARVNAMTEEELEANALSDPDNPPLTDEELARMRPFSDLRIDRQSPR